MAFRPEPPEPSNAWLAQAGGRVESRFLVLGHKETGFCISQPGCKGNARLSALEWQARPRLAGARSVTLLPYLAIYQHATH